MDDNPNEFLFHDYNNNLIFLQNHSVLDLIILKLFLTNVIIGLKIFKIILVNQMTRYFVVLYLDAFTTKVSGDIGGEGEFYFKCNGQRYPNKGVIKLKKNETFDPEPNPVFYTALTDDKDVKFDIEVWEEDKGRDDKFIDQNVKYPIKPTEEKIELHDKKNKCSLKLVLKIAQAEKW